MPAKRMSEVVATIIAALAAVLLAAALSAAGAAVGWAFAQDKRITTIENRLQSLGKQMADLPKRKEDA